MKGSKETQVNLIIIIIIIITTTAVFLQRWVPGAVLSAVYSIILPTPQAVSYYYLLPFAKEEPGFIEVN